MPAWGELALIAGLLSINVGLTVWLVKQGGRLATLQAQLDAKVGSIEAATGALDVGAKVVDPDAVIAAKLAEAAKEKP